MEVIGSIYTEASDNFQKGIIGGISRCIKAEKHDLGVVLMEQRRLGNLYGDDRAALLEMYGIKTIFPHLSRLCKGGEESR